MVHIHGEALYGKVDCVRPLFYVATKFSHANFFPIWPLATELVLEGSEKGNLLPNAEYLGTKIPFSWKSMLLGYLSGLLAATALVMFAGFGILVGAFYFNIEQTPAIFVAIGMFFASLGCIWFVMTREGAVSAALVVTLIAITVGVYGNSQWMLRDPAIRKAKEMWASNLWMGMAGSGALAIVAATRLASSASLDRAVELAEYLGYRRDKFLAQLAQRDFASMREQLAGMIHERNAQQKQPRTT